MVKSSLKIQIPDNFSEKSAKVKKLKDGKYFGRIVDIKAKKQISSGREVIEFSVKVKSTDGFQKIVKFLPDNDLDSPWLQNVLINLGHKLRDGSAIDISKDIGAKVEVEITNVKKGDWTYTNIVKMVKIDNQTKTDDDKTPDKSSEKIKSQSKPTSDSRNKSWNSDLDDDDDPDDEDTDEDEDEENADADDDDEDEDDE